VFSPVLDETEADPEPELVRCAPVPSGEVTLSSGLLTPGAVPTSLLLVECSCVLTTVGSREDTGMV
jgi:hypothetical protein